MLLNGVIETEARSRLFPHKAASPILAGAAIAKQVAKRTWGVVRNPNKKRSDKALSDPGASREPQPWLIKRLVGLLRGKFPTGPTYD